MSSDVGQRPLRVGACLSLSGTYARFGSQAARALRIWQSMDGAVDLILEDDKSDPHTLEAVLPRVASRCDVLLGPYSTQLMKTAGRIAADEDWLLWNHGGSGDDVEAAHPGHVVSVLTPTSRYAEPFLRYLVSDHQQAQLWIVHGRGRFGRQVAAGAELLAAQRGIHTVRISHADTLSSAAPSGTWDLFSVGQFEEDIMTVKRAQALPHPPRIMCAVAAGVREFGSAVGNAEETLGIAQWFPGRRHTPTLGPLEADFLAAYANLTGAMPDYPAVQAVAGAVLATHCARLAGGTTRDLLWPAAVALDSQTLFGGFRIDPVTGTQIKHQTLLVRWTTQGPVAVQSHPAASK
jgi:ABC-type branched-subunit amino acid transport system substrate-binding protein